MDAEYFKKRLDKLKGHRSNFDVLWDEVKKVTWPDGGDFLEELSRGDKTTRKIYETTATNALDKFASAMESFLVPRHLKWHGLRASDEALNQKKPVKEFFEELTKILFRMRVNPRARFYGQMGENIKSLGAYGNGCLYLDEAENGRGLRYKHIPVGQAWIETDFNGQVDTVYYEYKLTAKAAAQKWAHAVPERISRALEGNGDFDEFTFIHAVIPNDPDKIDPESVVAEGMPFHAYDIFCEDDSILPTVEGEQFQGYFEMPYLWSRFTLKPTEMYGRGPAMLALPDILTLQEMEKTFIRSGHRVAAPPLLVAHDGRLGRGARRIRMSPDGLTYGGVDESGRPKIIPLQTGARLDITIEMMNQKRDAIFDTFFVKLFDILEKDRVEMTATEVLERAKEKGQLIAPIVGRQQSELLGPMIEREIGILTRQGLLPPLPGELLEANGEYEIEYDTLATRMQQTDEVAAFQRLTEVFRPYVEIDPILQQVVNAEDAYRDFGETLGIRPTLFKSEDEMASIKEQAAKAAEQAAQAEQAPQVAQAVKTASEVQGAG